VALPSTSLLSNKNRAEQGGAADWEQRPLVPRSRCSQRLTSGVRRQSRSGKGMGATESVSSAPSCDPFGAFCPGPRVQLHGSPLGPLAGLMFAAKDVFDVAGHVTGAGNPDWHRTHGPAERTATAVQRLLEVGATLVGKTQMDELAYGVLGENVHYGTPVNPAAPTRVPGGSSSGSASAVAAGLVDFALGSDTACSVRLPAALCGLFGIRPTFGRVSTEGMVPLSPSLDTVGWFARDAELFQKIGRVLLQPGREVPPATALLVAEDAFALASPKVVHALQVAVEAVAGHFRSVQTVRLIDAGSEPSLEWFWFHVWSVQVREVWALHGQWILNTKPGSRVLSRETLAAGADSTPAELEEARATWRGLRDAVLRKITDGSLMCLPTVADCGPERGSDPAKRMAFSRPTLCLMSVAGVAGLPQVTLPVAEIDGCPVGLSLIGAAGCDEKLLELAAKLMAGPDPAIRRPTNHARERCSRSVAR
jgi:amidase